MNLKIFLGSSILISASILFGCVKNSKPNEELVVSFLVDKTDSSVGETINFTNTTQNGTSYKWDFGDGFSSTDENCSHKYNTVGDFTVTLSVKTDTDSKSANKSILIWEHVLECTFNGENVIFQGPLNFNAQPVKLIFNNQSSGIAAANLVKHKDGYTHQDMLDIFVDGISYAHHPSWTFEVSGVYSEKEANKSHVWIGTLEPGIYTLVCARIDPLCVWYAAGLTVD